MAKEKQEEIQRIVKNFRNLVSEASTITVSPTIEEVIKGWHLLLELDKAKTGQAYNSIHGVIIALTAKLPVADRNDITTSRLALFFATQTVFFGGGEFVKGCTPAEKDAVKNFAAEMRNVIIKLALGEY